MKDSTGAPGRRKTSVSSRIPRFYRLPVEQRLAYLQRTFGLTNEELARVRDGSALRVEHAVNMVENAVGVFGLPLGLGLNFLVDGRDYIVPMAIEEASNIAAVSKSALIIRGGGGFTTSVDDPVMIGQLQLLKVPDMAQARAALLAGREKLLAAANAPGERMVERGGGVFDFELRELDGGPEVGPMLIVHLLMDVREAMGANAVNSACEAAAPVAEELSGGRVNLRILSNLADRRLARASFELPVEALNVDGFTPAEVAARLIAASRFAWHDPYRAATHNKGIFNGICAAAVALGQDWRAIEAGAHAYAARDGQYRSLTRMDLRNGVLHGEIELPMQVGWTGGAVGSHPAVGILRKVSGVQDARELAGLLAAVGLAQTFGANLALATVGIQQGHMSLHARSVALSIGTPAELVDQVAGELVQRGEVKVAAAERILKQFRRAEREDSAEQLPVEAAAPGKVVLFGEHAVVYGHAGITASIDIGLKVRLSHDPDGPRFLQPRLTLECPGADCDIDMRRFSRAVDAALEQYGLSHEPLAIEVESDLVPGMGLGSSAAFSTALCRALRRYARGGEDEDTGEGLFAEVQELERIFHGQPSGIDAATVISGGVLWFRKGPPREVLPIRLPRPVAGMVCIVEPGARTIELVRQVAHSRELDQARTDAILEEIGALTAEAGSALGSGDYVRAGMLMLRNHEALERLGVSTPRLDEAVELLLNNGALGAKLTGAGGGGAVVALVEPEQLAGLVRSVQGSFLLAYPFELGSY